MYLRILFIVFQCSLPGFAMYQLTALTACAISGLVQIIANIKLSIADAYSTRDIFFISTSFVGHIL